MSDNIATSSHRRSEASLFFEKVVLAAGRAGTIPRLADIDFAALRAYEPFIAIVKPDHETRTLRFSLAGAALSQFVGHDLKGIDYLDLNRPDLGIATFGRRTTAREQRVLRTLEAHAESSVGDIAIRIEAEGAAEYERTVFDKTLEEVAIVGIGVGGADVGQRLGRLVNEIVVEAGDHGGSESCWSVAI